NINCTQGLPLANEKRAVVMILLSGGTRWCSGAMINNVEQDAIPYLLTALHCMDSNHNNIISTSEIQDAEQWIIMFNYESPDCSGTDGTTNQTVSGTALKANNSATDFALLRLSTSPPESYQVYYAGWSRNTTAASHSSMVHHPSGDIKKIAIDNDPAVSSTWSNTPSGSHWELFFDQGANEGGSSGAPYFNENNLIIAQHHGNADPLYDRTNDCDVPHAWGGKFSLSWGNGSSSSSRLKDWLDPNDTDVPTLDGLEPASVSITGPGDLLEGDTGTWSANVANPGSGTTSYAWDKKDDGSTNWFPLGTAQTQSVTMGSVSFTLRVTVHTGGQFVDDTFYVFRIGDGGLLRRGTADVSNPIPEAFALESNYPNPFNPSTTIKYELPEASSVSLAVYNLLGNEIFGWVKNREDAGYKQITWNGKDRHGNSVPAGIYIYKLTAKSYESGQVFTENRKMVLLK
ncbi:T9SS type A sorting domain-containing protein, partial [Caldithrix abyssi]|nr:T9SS type A sorting domain-containing protein [Caldithrix abyssi]